MEINAQANKNGPHEIDNMNSLPDFDKSFGTRRICIAAMISDFNCYLLSILFSYLNLHIQPSESNISL